jgi:hypothetical protein
MQPVELHTSKAVRCSKCTYRRSRMSVVIPANSDRIQLSERLKNLDKPSTLPSSSIGYAKIVIFHAALARRIVSAR